MKIECPNGTCYHCKVELQDNNKQYCPEHLEVYNELFNEFQEFYELNNEKIRITRIKYFKASTRRYIRHYLNNDYDGIPISIYMDVNGWSEEYFEKIYRVIHKDDFAINSAFDTNNIISLDVMIKNNEWNRLSNFENFNKLKF